MTRQNGDVSLLYIRTAWNYTIVADRSPGLCEMVMSNECESSGAAAGDASERDTYFEPHSPDIVMDMDIGGHRRRSNTSQRLDKLKKERKNAARIKHIIWQPNANPLPGESLTRCLLRCLLQLTYPFIMSTTVVKQVAACPI